VKLQSKQLHAWLCCAVDACAVLLLSVSINQDLAAKVSALSGETPTKREQMISMTMRIE
jgi:hypothetical protein